MNKLRKTVLVLDRQSDVCKQISEEIKKLGYHDLCVGDLGGLWPLIDSRDRIHTVVLADPDSSMKGLKATLMALKQLTAGTPIIFTTGQNEPAKEKELRKIGVFFYHVAADGMTPLVEAIRSAMNEAVRMDLFVPAADAGQV